MVMLPPPTQPLHPSRLEKERRKDEKKQQKLREKKAKRAQEKKAKQGKGKDSRGLREMRARAWAGREERRTRLLVLTTCLPGTQRSQSSAWLTSCSSTTTSSSHPCASTTWLDGTGTDQGGRGSGCRARIPRLLAHIRILARMSAGLWLLSRSSASYL